MGIEKKEKEESDKERRDRVGKGERQRKTHKTTERPWMERDGEKAINWRKEEERGTKRG